jgi:hypothetical protein
MVAEDPQAQYSSDALGSSGILRAEVPRATAGCGGEIEDTQIAHLHHGSCARHECVRSAFGAAFDSQLRGQPAAVNAGTGDLPIVVAHRAPVAPHQAGLPGECLKTRRQQRGACVKRLRHGHLLTQRIGHRHRDRARARHRGQLRSLEGAGRSLTGNHQVAVRQDLYGGGNCGRAGNRRERKSNKIGPHREIRPDLHALHVNRTGPREATGDEVTQAIAAQCINVGERIRRIKPYRRGCARGA